MQLKKLIIKNFKGTQDIEIEFTEMDTFIHGANFAGKTTLMDAYLWLLTGKDSNGKADGKGGFQPRPMDKDNNLINYIDVSVTGVFDFATISKTLKQKWQKKKGNETPELTGNECIYTWNEVPKTETEFKSRLNEIVMEDVLRLVSDPLAFNNLDWKARRALVFKMVGFADNDSEIMSSQSKFKDILPKLIGKTLEEYRKEISSKKSKIKKEMEEIPERIDESTKSIKVIDYTKDSLNASKLIIDNQLKELFENSQKSTIDETATKIIALGQEKTNITIKNSNLEFAAQQSINRTLLDKKTSIENLSLEITKIESQILTAKNDIIAHNASILTLTNTNASLRDKFLNLTIPENAAMCPIHQGTPCKIHGENWIVGEKEAINQKGADNKKQIDELTAIIADLEVNLPLLEEILISKKEKLETLKNSPAGVKTVAAILADNTEYHNAITRLAVIDEEIKTLSEAKKPTEDNSVATQKRQELQQQLNEISTKLQVIYQNESTEARIKELTERQKTLASELSSLEQMEFKIEEYNKYKVGLVSGLVENVFPSVRFKMFETQLNGGLNDQLCDTIGGNGVTWINLSTSQKINAGLEIISVIQKHTGFIAPIWIDNRESVTNIFKTSAQTISLVVDPTCETLTIK